MRGRAWVEGWKGEVLDVQGFMDYWFCNFLLLSDIFSRPGHRSKFLLCRPEVVYSAFIHILVKGYGHCYGMMIGVGGHWSTSKLFKSMPD